MVTDPMFKVVMTLPADVMVDPGADLSPVVTGTATATATTTPTPVVSHEDSAITPLNLGLNALFLLDDAASAMVIQDFSGNGFLGTNHEAVAGTAGKVGGALYFNGTSQYVSLGNPEGLNFTGNITLAAWVKPEAVDGIRNIVAHGYATSPSSEVGLRINGGQYQIFSWDGVTHMASVAVPAGDIGVWVHLAGVYDGTAWRLYRNGVEVAASASSVGAVLVNGDWAIGARGTGAYRFFKGAIDEVGIWNRALAASEIAGMAALGAEGLGMSRLVGQFTRTWTAADGFGATVSGTQVITLAHTALPVVTAPADTVVELGTDMSPAVTRQATATPADAVVPTRMRRWRGWIGN